MFMKKIQVSEEKHTKLSNLDLKSKIDNNTIGRLISAHEKEYVDDFTDEQATYNEIDDFENGDYEGTVEVDVETLRKKYKG